MLKLRLAVRDVVDALATQTRDGPALIQCFEAPLFERRSLPGSFRLPSNWCAEVEAATRLLYARIALRILSAPLDPSRGGREEAILGDDWLLARFRHSRIARWTQAFDHAARDLLFILTMELRRDTVGELSERSMAWPEDLRRRWTYAAAVGAIGGYVF